MFGIRFQADQDVMACTPSHLGTQVLMVVSFALINIAVLVNEWTHNEIG
jgi:hypothetical protein